VLPFTTFSVRGPVKIEMGSVVSMRFHPVAWASRWRTFGYQSYFPGKRWRLVTWVRFSAAMQKLALHTWLSINWCHGVPGKAGVCLSIRMVNQIHGETRYVTCSQIKSNQIKFIKQKDQMVTKTAK